MAGSSWNAAVRRSSVKVAPIVRTRSEAAVFLAPWFMLLLVAATALGVMFDRNLQSPTPLVIVGIATLLTLGVDRLLTAFWWEPRRADCETWGQARARGSYEARCLLRSGHLPD